MKNVQVIDGAENCAYEIYAFSEEEFSQVFPLEGQNVEFIEDAIKRIGRKKLGLLLSPVWNRPVRKVEVVRIHGTLFYELYDRKKFYPTKCDLEMVTGFEGG